MGQAYDQLLADREMLLGQMQMYAACSDPEIRDATRAGFAELFRFVEQATGLWAPSRSATSSRSGCS